MSPLNARRNPIEGRALCSKTRLARPTTYSCPLFPRANTSAGLAARLTSSRSSENSAGLLGEFVPPGAGVVAIDTGLLVVSLDATGAATNVQVTPTRDGRIAGFICPYVLG